MIFLTVFNLFWYIFEKIMDKSQVRFVPMTFTYGGGTKDEQTQSLYFCI